MKSNAGAHSSVGSDQRQSAPATLAPRHSPGRESAFSIPSLDGIRCLSVTIVFAGHAGLNLWIPAPFGVTIFFFLSGYLITTLLRMEFERTGGISFRAFYLRRAFRLFPPLYLVLGIGCLLTLLGVFAGHRLQLGSVLAQVFYLSNYQVLATDWTGGGRPPGTSDLWSLAVEEHFYIIFPLLYLLLRRHIRSARSQVLCLVGVCAMVLAWRLILTYALGASFDRTYVGSDTRIDSILFGCMLAIWGNPFLDRHPEGSVPEPAWKRLWAPMCVPLSIVVIALTFRIRNQQIAGTLTYTLQGLALIPLFVVAVRYADWGIIKVLNLRAVKFIGVLSYSIYIVHSPIIYAFHERLHAPHIVKGLVYLVVTLLAALAIYQFVEKPFARIRRRLARATGPAQDSHRAGWRGVAVSTSEPGRGRITMRYRPNADAVHHLVRWIQSGALRLAGSDGGDGAGAGESTVSRRGGDGARRGSDSEPNGSPISDESDQSFRSLGPSS